MKKIFLNAYVYFLNLLPLVSFEDALKSYVVKATFKTKKHTNGTTRLISKSPVFVDTDKCRPNGRGKKTKQGQVNVIDLNKMIDDNIKNPWISLYKQNLIEWKIVRPA